MTIQSPLKSPVLVVTVGARACAIPLRHVGEIMRPLHIEPVAGTPAFVRGVSVIRGAPTPVVDLEALLGPGELSVSWGRFVTIKLGERRVALGVDGVVGLSHLESAWLGELPPLLRDIEANLLEAIGTRDAQLLLVLRAARIVPEEVWKTLAAEPGP